MKIKRQVSSSHARLSYMSPSSQQKRKSNQQNDEVSSITSFIQNNHQKELEKLYHKSMINITTKFIITLYNCRS